MTAKLAAAAVLICAGMWASGASAAAALESKLGMGGRFGEVSIYRATEEPKNFVVFASGDGGWNLGVVDMARELTTLDATVVGVNVVSYIKSLNAAGEECVNPAREFEELGRAVQTKLGFKTIRKTILVGYSSGATLVYALLGQGDKTAFAGALALGFCPDLYITKAMCKENALAYHPDPKHNGVLFDQMPKIAKPFVALQGTQDQVCAPAETEAFVKSLPTGEIVMLPKVGHGFSVPKNWMPQFRDAFARIAAH